jgi:hypothetical protein
MAPRMAAAAAMFIASMEDIRHQIVFGNGRGIVRKKKENGAADEICFTLPLCGNAAHLTITPHAAHGFRAAHHAAPHALRNRRYRRRKRQYRLAVGGSGHQESGRMKMFADVGASGETGHGVSPQRRCTIASCTRCADVRHRHAASNSNAGSPARFRGRRGCASASWRGICCTRGGQQALVAWRVTSRRDARGGHI